MMKNDCINLGKLVPVSTLGQKKEREERKRKRKKKERKRNLAIIREGVECVSIIYCWTIASALWKKIKEVGDPISQVYPIWLDLTTLF